MFQAKFQILAAILLFAIVTSARAENELTDAEKMVISKAVVTNLKDPESARFKWLPFAESLTEKYCGLVNAKNSFGGYTGDVPFLVLLVWRENKLQFAATIGIGGAGPDSPKTTAMLTMCADAGYTNFYGAE